MLILFTNNGNDDGDDGDSEDDDDEQFENVNVDLRKGLTISCISLA